MKSRPLKLNQFLVKNVNSYGAVEYGIPMRTTDNETRTSTNRAHRFIPNIVRSVDCTLDTPLPDRLLGRDMVVEKESYKTTSGEYCVKPNPNNASEKYDKGINCKKTIYMTAVANKLEKASIKKPVILSEMKDCYRGGTAPGDIDSVKPVDPEYIYDAVASGRNEVPCISETEHGAAKILDPYLTTYRNYHRPFTAEDQYGIGAKDHITYYTDMNFPKARGFGPRFKECWMPLLARPHRAVWDRIRFKKEYKAVAHRHPDTWLPGAFKTETSNKYRWPYAVSELVTYGHGVEYPVANYQPNPYQTNCAPNMYCSEYCHIAQKSPVNVVIDQLVHEPTRTPCKRRHVVSRDY